MATTVDELLIQVTLNAKQLQQSLNSAEQSISKFADKITNTLSVALEAIALKFSLSFGKNLVETFATTGSKLYFLSQQIGESVSTLDQWGVAVQKAGGNTDSFFNTINNLHNKLVDMKFNGDLQTAGLFGMMGIRTSQSNGQLKKTSEILLEISDFFKGQSKEQQQFFGRKLGLDDATVRVLAKGREETLKLVNAQKSLWNDKTAAQAEKQREQLIRYDRAIEQLKLTIAEKLLPYANQFINWIQKFVNQHGNDMAIIVDKIVGALAEMVGYIPKVTAYIGELNKSLGLTAGDLGKILAGILALKVAKDVFMGLAAAANLFLSPITAALAGIMGLFEIWKQIQEKINNPENYNQKMSKSVNDKSSYLNQALSWISDKTGLNLTPEGNKKAQPSQWDKVIDQLAPKVAQIESSGGTNIDSGNGAYGAYQVRPNWGNRARAKEGLPAQTPEWYKDPKNSLETYKLMMRQNLKSTGGDVDAAIKMYSGNNYGLDKVMAQNPKNIDYAKIGMNNPQLVNQQPQPQLVNQPVQNTLATAQSKPQQQAANNNVNMNINTVNVKADNPQELIAGVQSKAPVPLSFNQSPRIA